MVQMSLGFVIHKGQVFYHVYLGRVWLGAYRYFSQAKDKVDRYRAELEDWI